MYTDVLILTDASGNELTRKKQVGHVMEYLSFKAPELLNYPLTLRSETTGYTLTITPETTINDWREFSKDCAMAYD